MLGRDAPMQHKTERLDDVISILIISSIVVLFLVINSLGAL